MLYTVYYIIRPNNALAELLTDKPSVQPLFGEPQLWIKEEGGFTSFKTSDYITQVKLIFLAAFRTDALRYNNYESNRLVETMLGDAIVDEFIFDKWWDIERIELATDFEAVVRRVSLDSLLYLSKTGHVTIDDWMTDIANLKSEGKL